MASAVQTTKRQSGGILKQVTHTLAFCSTETPQRQERQTHPSSLSRVALP